MEVIDDLLRIKKFREQKAELALTKARNAHAQALSALSRARDDLVNCRESCDRRQQALYADLLSRLVVRAEIDAVAFDVEEMRKEIKAAEAVVETKKEERDEAENQLEQARQHHHAAMRNREKFTELSAKARLERLAVIQYKEDPELEEVRPPGQPGKTTDDADGHATEDADSHDDFSVDLGVAA